MNKLLCFLSLVLAVSVFGCGTHGDGNIMQSSTLRTYKTSYYSIAIPESWSEDWQASTFHFLNPEKSCTIFCSGVRVKGSQTVETLASEAQKEFLASDPEVTQRILNTSGVFLDGKPATRIDMLVTSKKKGKSTFGTDIIVKNKNWIMLISVIGHAEDEKQLKPTIQTIVKSITCVDTAN